MHWSTLLLTLSMGVSHAAPAPVSSYTLSSMSSDEFNVTHLAVGDRWIPYLDDSRNVTLGSSNNLTIRDVAGDGDEEDTRDPQNPTHWFDCTVKYNVFYDRITVKDDIRDWDTSKLGKHGEGLKHQLKGCGALTGWSFREPDFSKKPYMFKAVCNLPIGVKGCVVRAIKTAGAPARAKCRNGQIKSGG